jgi:hypothetical protein
LQTYEIEAELFCQLLEKMTICTLLVFYLLDPTECNLPARCRVEDTVVDDVLSSVVDSGVVDVTVVVCTTSVVAPRVVTAVICTVVVALKTN